MKNCYLRRCVITLVTAAAWPLLRAADVSVHWLETPPGVPAGVSFGVPWAQGAMKQGESFVLVDRDDRANLIATQTWPLAFWPDGSVKWTGVAAAIGANQKGPFTLQPGGSSADGDRVRVQTSDTQIEINTGKLLCQIATTGEALIKSLVVDGREVARDGRLVCVLQNGPEIEVDSSPKRERFASKIEKVTVEQSGPIRAVVKVDGKHHGVQSGREWLPFSVRLYFYAGQEAVRVVHTIVFDGDQEKDFIRGLGLAFAVPLREGVQNRHVRFSGADGGLWAEPIQAGPGNATQAAGQAISGGRYYGADHAGDDYAIWSDFKLSQPTPDGFTITKRTNPQSTWIFAGAGKRATGLAFVGDVTGGLGVSLKDFWQSYPTALEVHDAGKASAQLTVWLWSPDGPAMDMRHYDTKAHGLNSTYEDVQPGMSTAYGVRGATCRRRP